MTCTMPAAKFAPIDNHLAREYVLNCADEVFRGLMFVGLEPGQRDALKREVAHLCKKLEDALLD